VSATLDVHGTLVMTVGRPDAQQEEQA
jgi:hypothetical protein